MSISSYAQELIAEPDNKKHVEAFINSLVDEDGFFYAQEDTLFDYKQSFPHSMSDDYFYGIIRLIFSLYNSYGGIIIFGVHDKERTPNHNKSIIKIENFNNRIREISGECVNIYHHNYCENGCDVDLLVISKRDANKTPIFPIKNIGKFKKKTLWMRQGHEVITASSKDLSFLFSPRNSGNSPENLNISSALPSNPSTIKTFVGRIDVMSQLYHWIVAEDEHRKFLWGRGGRGKSTIAYEFAKILKDFGRSIKIYGDRYFDRVIYLSAKNRQLDPITRKIDEKIHEDFTNFDEMLKIIVEYCNYSEENCDSYNIDELKKAIKEIFDHENILIILDDIDTLTNNNKNIGSDWLYKTSIRARGLIRILYTQRNFPGSSENQIEVPKFYLDDDYREFVVKCCNQFDVEEPDKKILEHDLLDDSEGIPLIIETIIGLRRTAGNYEKALSLFRERQGEEARAYLFDREYESLPPDGQAKNILSAIAEFSRPVSIDDLMAIVEYGESAIVDAIGLLLSFFLSTEISNEGDTKYLVNPVTRAYVNKKGSILSTYGKIKQRVKSYKSGMKNRPAEYLRLEMRVERAIKRGNLVDAIKLFDQPFTPQIEEHSAFRRLRASVAAKQEPPRIVNASGLIDTEDSVLRQAMLPSSDEKRYRGPAQSGGSRAA